MPQLPESIRPYAEAVAKYHFWILAGIVPLLLIPGVFAASGALDRTIGSKRSEIDGHLSALRQISGEAEHPNEKWVAKVEERTTAVRQDLLTEWKAFWESQAPLRVWPDDPLGEDFVTAVTAAPPGKQPQLKRAMLERYQDRVRMLVRQLPPRMGCTEMMEGDVAGGVGRQAGPSMDRPRRPQPRGREGFGMGDGLEPREPLVWDPADQQRVFQSFDWIERPTTTQVLLAQEEIWVYQLFCDAVRQFNAGETEPAKIGISEVQELAVGYPAAEDKPGGTGTGRVLKKSAGGMDFGLDAGLGGEAGMEMPGDPSMMGMDGEAGGQGRPPHPRFMGVGGGREERRGGPPMGPMGMEGEGMEAGPALSPDEALQQWIYVDFNGKPLLASELGTVPDAQMLRLMPFTLRVVMDQRKLDQLLAQLASKEIPIDVRQVRLNPVEGRHGAAESGGRGGRGGGPQPRGGFERRMTEGSLGQAEGMRDYDMTVELRGTVALAMPPRSEVLAGTPDAAGVGP